MKAGEPVRRGSAGLAFALLLLACGGVPALAQDRGADAAAAGTRAGANDARERGSGPLERGSGALGRRIAALEQRESLLEAANDIKRLQRAYGYYVDRGLWDEAADLFAEDGTIEIGLDGVYVGKKRVRQYLHALGSALGGGRTGLPEGRLNEHLQLMGAVTIAPDGRTAKARWRDLGLTGQLGGGADWGEGPYENEYVRRGGVWKIETLHWYQSMVVPYAGGWAKNEDANGGKYVSSRLPPDRPPSVSYETWPHTFLPPFDFDNPVASAAPATRGAAPGSGAGTQARPEAGPEVALPSGPVPDGDALQALARRAAVLGQQVDLLEDQRAVENLQRTYGYYIEEGLWSEAADLFAEDGTFEVGGRGVYVGKERVLAYLRSIDAEGPRHGRLYDRMQLQAVVHVAPDGKTAKGRWHLFAQEADWGKFAEWGLGIYENDYVKQGGVWKISHLRIFPTMYTPYEDGWGKTALPAPGYASKLAPDRPPTTESRMYPAVSVVPFHYPNPVSGGPVYKHTPADYAARSAKRVDPDELGRTLASLEHRIGLLEDADAVERLHAIYGYYLARNQWDDLADIFAKDGAIEIALRGVYVGRASVRRNLDLYGKPGVQFGLLHNHMQFQPVIHVAPDGLSAKMRSRAFSIMGNYHQLGMWMGGVYENEYVKVDGVWQIKKDQVFNTYFVPYDVGWKNAPQRDPPGVTASNPPDLPPSVPFVMYPKQFVPTFHYPNPVTGRPVVVPAGARARGK